MPPEEWVNSHRLPKYLSPVKISAWSAAVRDWNVMEVFGHVWPCLAMFGHLFRASSRIMIEPWLKKPNKSCCIARVSQNSKSPHLEHLGTVLFRRITMAIQRACFWFYGREVELVIAGPLNEKTSHFPSLAKDLLKMKNCYDCEKEWPFQEVMGLENLLKHLNDECGFATYMSWRHDDTDLHALGLGSTLDWSQHVQVDSHPQQYPTTTVSIIRILDFVAVLGLTISKALRKTFFPLLPRGRKEVRRRAALLALSVACLLQRQQTTSAPQLSKHLAAARAAQVLQLQSLPGQVGSESWGRDSYAQEAPRKTGLKEEPQRVWWSKILPILDVPWQNHGKFHTLKGEERRCLAASAWFLDVVVPGRPSRLVRRCPSENLCRCHELVLQSRRCESGAQTSKDHRSKTEPSLGTRLPGHLWCQPLPTFEVFSHCSGPGCDTSASCWLLGPGCPDLLGVQGAFDWNSAAGGGWGY